MALFPITRHSSPVTRPSPHPLVTLASKAITAFIQERRVIEPPASLFSLFPEARSAAGTFVCLKRQGALRGCLGTTEPARPTLALEVIENAIAAATRDPRFSPVDRSELDELEITVDVLRPAELITDHAMLDHRRYGIIVRSGHRRGVLLPDIEQINSVAEQIATARLKAGVGPHEPVEILRFEVTRYR